jgi:hydrogenase expression/formation protein HypD
MAHKIEEEIVKKVLDLASILREKMGRKIKLMEVCGTHTMVISKSGIRSLFSDTVDLLSGPGCPVCVTSQRDIDRVILLSREEDVTICTFGDMVKVPGTFSSLEREKARGRKVEIFYSPLDALSYAEEHKGEEVVFLGIGFETTIPLISHSILEAKKKGIKNFSVLSLHKCLPPAMRVLLDDRDLSLDGLILPGHVSTITGRKAFDFIAKDYGIPSCISGFEPEDVIEAIARILVQLMRGRKEVEIGYRRLVKEDGNLRAMEMIERVFEPSDAEWRGFGEIPKSGLKIREEFEEFDTLKRFRLPDPGPSEKKRGCICGEIVRGKKKPKECDLFSEVCNPSRPFGPCMVSQEGACAAYYYYGA